MLQAYLLFFTGLTLSSVAIYYSVAGLGAIFAGALVPIYIMGTSLEVAKLVAASWLKSNWSRAPWFMRLYLFAAIAGLMSITSIGIFGYLSKAHIEQSSSINIVREKVDILDSKIKIEQSVVEQYRADLQVLNEQIAKFSELGAVSKGVAVRDTQKVERDNILEKIDRSQQTISALQQQREPIAIQLKTAEADVGPIKYIATFIYGDNTDSSSLEHAVTWLIILIVIIFDPLAIALLLAAQLTVSWNKALSTPDVVTPKVETPTLVKDETASVEAERTDTTCGNEQPTATEDIKPNDQQDCTDESVASDSSIELEDSVVDENDAKYSDGSSSAEKSKTIITEEAKRYITDDSKKKTYLVKDSVGHTVTKTQR